MIKLIAIGLMVASMVSFASAKEKKAASEKRKVAQTGNIYKLNDGHMATTLTVVEDPQKTAQLSFNGEHIAQQSTCVVVHNLVYQPSEDVFSNEHIVAKKLYWDSWVVVAKTGWEAKANCGTNYIYLDGFYKK